MKTQKVRIALAINTEGDWYAWGAYTHDDESALDEVSGQLNDYTTLHWIEAEVPIPSPMVIEGKVTE